MAALQSGLFTTSSEVKDRLQACADSHAHNIHRRHDPQGDAVAAIQAALQLIIPDDGIDLAEIGSATYGPTTARAVQRFKDTPSLNGTGRKILGPGQTTPDDIVGRQTIAALDAQLVRQGGSPVPTVTTKTPGSLATQTMKGVATKSRKTRPIPNRKTGRKKGRLET